MKSLLIRAALCLFLAGCLLGRREMIVPAESPARSQRDSLLTVLEAKITRLETQSKAAIKPPPPVLMKPPAKIMATKKDSSTIIWPDDRVYKFRFSYKKVDTQGNRIEPIIRLQLEQFNEDTTRGWVDLSERLDRAESDYWVAGDTLYLNVPYLRKYNPSPAGEYVFRWRLRLRLEDFFYPEKNSGWVFIKRTITLVRADRWEGMPVKPIFEEMQ